MFGNALVLALALGIPGNATLSRLGKVRVHVMHGGPPVPVKIVLRHREQKSDEWVYVEDLNYLPRRLKTSRKGRSVLLSIPSGLSTFIQSCVRYTPKSSGASRELLLSVESCANLPKPTLEPSLKRTILRVPASNYLHLKDTAVDSPTQKGQV